MDESGRTIRWRRTFEPEEPSYQKALCGKGERILSEVETEAYFTQLEEELYERLESR